METTQHSEPITALENSGTIIKGECPTCISGTDPIILSLGVEILQDLD